MEADGYPSARGNTQVITTKAITKTSCMAIRSEATAPRTAPKKPMMAGRYGSMASRKSLTRSSVARLPGGRWGPRRRVILARSPDVGNTQGVVAEQALHVHGIEVDLDRAHLEVVAGVGRRR